MKIKGLLPMPVIQRLVIGVYVFPERHAHLAGRPPEVQAKHALAGPFPDRYRAAHWVLEHLESKLLPAQLPIWGEALERAGGIHADVFHLIGLVDGLLSGASAERIFRAAGPSVQRVDRKALSAGRDAA